MDKDIISSHFKYEEFAVSKDYPELAAKIKLRGLDCVKLHYLVWMLLEPVRVVLDHPFKILSGIRSDALNTAVGGAANSEHLFHDYSCACDFTVVHRYDELSSVAVFESWNKLQKLQFGQLIYYAPEHGNFIHISVPTRKHRGEVIRKTAGGYQQV